jgi:imidazoleglycerol-phosphate dehydratase
MSVIVRETSETKIKIELSRIPGELRIDTSVPFLDHMMTAVAKYAGWTLNLSAKGDLRHHLIEDVAIALGTAVADDVKEPIVRFGHQVVPMDEALVECALDFGGRPFYRGKLPSSLYDHWMRSFADDAQCTLHVLFLRGQDRHLVVEAGFKALGMALRQALAPSTDIMSTKGEVKVDR